MERRKESWVMTIRVITAVLMSRIMVLSLKSVPAFVPGESVV